jgi:Alpha-L-arabinofuranosidase B, catalytic
MLGSALRVQRSSDSTQQDIGFAANGQLNTTTLSTFCGVVNCSIVTWYDQSTNANNSTASSALPAIVNAGTTYTLNGNPAIRFGPVAHAAMAFTVSLSQPTTIATAVQANSQATNSGITDGNATSPRQLFGQSGGTIYQMYAGTG